MDKRLINFILVSLLLFFGYMEMLRFFGLDQPNEQGEDQSVATQPADAAAPGEMEREPVEPISPEGDPEEFADVEAEARAEVPVARYTLGSVDPASGYPFLVTFVNQGAAVERVELSHPRFRDLNDKSAYIGHLGLEAVEGGARISVVGPGTPAHQAGLQVGDVITALGEASVATADDVERLLQGYPFGQEISLTITRAGGSQNVTLTSMQRPLEVIRPEPELLADGERRHPLSYLLTLHTVGSRSTAFGEDELPFLPSLHEQNWPATLGERDGNPFVEFRFLVTSAELQKLGVESPGLEVIKRFALRPATEETKASEQPYDFQFEVELVNQGTEPLDVGYSIDGATGLPLEGWWYAYKTRPGFWSWGAAGVRDIVWRSVGDTHGMFANIQISDRVEEFEEQSVDTPYMVIRATEFPLEYVGTDAQYFNSSLLAAADGSPQVMQYVDARAVGPVDPTGKSNRTDVTFRAKTMPKPVAAQGSSVDAYRIFAGPKDVDVLARYGLGECIVYGWFKWPAQFMGVLLHALYAIVRNYGIAIILLTIIVRACMFPIGRQMAMNAKKMQELSPEIKKIKEKYPSDTEKQAKAQQELFRKHNYNPLAGCLPMFIQIPIFIGLYRALSVDIELRQTPLIPGLGWCSNLAGPDMLLRWDGLIPWDTLTGYTGWLGPYLNILPILSACVFIFHQKLFTPPPTDEQQEVQQKVMMFMPVMMCFFFFRMPAGLNLYFITSSLWALGERLMLPKDLKPGQDATPKKSLVSHFTGDDGNGASSATAVAAKKKRRKRSKKS